MSGVEAVARVLDALAFDDSVWRDTVGATYTKTDRQREARCRAQRILADPAPLLAALAEAGVLREVYTLARHDPTPAMSGPVVQRAGESPDRSVMETMLALPRSEGRWVERRYVTEWEAQS